MIEVQIGDSRRLIHGLADKSVDCVVTSPPYWGLRDYKTEPIIFDGLPDCEHEWIHHERIIETFATKGCGWLIGHETGQKDAKVISRTEHPEFWEKKDKGGDFCSKCGAWCGQLGLEPIPELFIKHLLNFFDDVKLKLKDEGNCFVNLGDSYMGSGQDSGKQGREISQSICPNRKIGEASPTAPASMKKHLIIKPKCLCMIPQRFAWDMIERGWIVRNEIIWAKPNHMPESVTDRLTKAHEVIYHFVKQGKYYYDLDAIREPHKDSSMERYQRPLKMGGAKYAGKQGFEIYSGNDWKPEGYTGKFEGVNNAESYGSPRARTQRTKFNEVGNKNASGLTNSRDYYRNNGLIEGNPKGKNPGDVWNITTQPYPESHFAVFPLELVWRPILAGCPIGGTVLDPFAGSGTVGEFCRHNDRNAILFELNPEYKKLIEDRAMLKVPELSEWCSTKEDA